MKAITATDTCFSTMPGWWGGEMNTDRNKRSDVTIEEARSAFDFDIVRYPSFDENGRRIPGHYHLRKSTDDAFIPSVGIGERFTPVQHHDVFSFIAEKIMPEIPDMKLETVGTLYGGGMGLVTAKMGDGFRIEGDDSGQDMRLFFANPCNGRGSLVMGFTTVRLLCQNQIAVARADAGRHGGFFVMHTKNAMCNVERALQMIKSQAVKADEMRRREERLARVNVTRGTVDRVLDAVYSLRGIERGTRSWNGQMARRDDVMVQFESGDTAMSMHGDTAWKLFNALSFPVFNPKRKSSRRDAGDILYSGMAGGAAQTVMKWFNLVEDIALAA